MRVIKFGQTHRRTGLRRRFVIIQIDDAVTEPSLSADVGGAERGAGGREWRYKVQMGSTGIWSAFRPIDVSADATDEQIKRAAVLHFTGRPGRESGQSADSSGQG